MSLLAQLTHGEASFAADYLNSSNDVTPAETIAALINALNRIDRLETRIEKMQAMHKQQIEVLEQRINHVNGDRS